MDKPFEISNYSDKLATGKDELALRDDKPYF